MQVSISVPILMTIKLSIMISSHSTYPTVDWLANWKINIASLMVANKPYLITSKQVVVVHLYLISKINMSNLRMFGASTGLPHGG